MLLPKAQAETPSLSNGYVTPTTGDTSTQFCYYVSYFDPGGIDPELTTVKIDGTLSFMTLYSGSPSNGVYCYGTVLFLGTHTYYFMFTTGSTTLYLPPPGTPYPGPTVSEPSIPDFSLSISPTLSVNQGSSGTTNVDVQQTDGYTYDVSLTALTNPLMSR